MQASSRGLWPGAEVSVTRKPPASSLMVQLIAWAKKIVHITLTLISSTRFWVSLTIPLER